MVRAAPPSLRRPTLREPSLSIRGEDVADDVAFLEVDDGLRDAGGVVGDPFEITRGVDQAEPGVEPFGVAADLVLELGQDGMVAAIDATVAGNDGTGERGVRLRQCVEAVADLFESLKRH